MAKTNKPRRRMDRYFKNLQKNAYILSYNKKGSCTTKIKKWDVIRKLTKKLIAEDEQTGKVAREPQNLDPGVQLLPRQDVMLYGTIPAMEQRVYSKCKNCCRVFNPRDILSHRTCSKSHTPHSSLLKKKVKSKSSNSKKTSSNGNSSSNSSNGNSSIVTMSPSSPGKDPLNKFEFKRRFTPREGQAESAPSMPELKVSVTKIGLAKVAKPTPVTTSTSTPTLTTSSDKSDSKVSSSKVTSSVHHSPKSPSSGHHSSKSSSGHSPRSPSSSTHHGPKSPSSSHHSPKSPSSSGHHRSKSPSSVHYSPRSPSKSGSGHHESSHHSSSTSHHSSKSSSKSTPMDTLPPSSSSSSHHHHSSSSSGHSSSRHKKSSSTSSKRSSSNSSSGNSSSSSAKILPKNYDPDIHCGVIEGNRGPCMRSITCSNHRLHLRKQVAGRSKDIHQLIAERKAAKENDLKHTTPPCSYTSPNGEAKDILSPNTSYVPVVGQIVSTTIDSSVTNSFVPIMPRMSGHQTRLSTTSVHSKKSSTTESENESAKVLTNGYISRAKNLENTQDNVVGTVPVVIMPVSPVSVASSVQLLKIGNNIISLESPQSATNPPMKKQVILPIPSNHTNAVRMYKSHPKPIILPNFGARKLGGAIMLANPLLLTTIDFKLETVNIERGLSGLNHSNSPHRPNILKGKGGVKTNCKRPASDKLATGDSKRLVPDVNGFILHADVSETADAPQYSGENGPSQHELIISLIDKYGF